MIEKPASYLTETNQKTNKTFIMKKTILSITILLTVFSTAFANRSDSNNKNALSSFQRDFKSASDVSWSETPRYMRVNFHFDKQNLYAYYDTQGNLIGLVHHMLTTGLSEDLQKQIKKNYAGYWVSELFQVTFEDGTYYFIELKNADETLVLSTEGSDNWHTYFKKSNTDKF
jgi:hypothetical protein